MRGRKLAKKPISHMPIKSIESKEKNSTQNSARAKESGEKPTEKPVPKVTLPRVVTRIPPVGSCYYHPNLPATFTCGRCGRPICRTCAKPRGDMVFCPECDAKFPAPSAPSSLPPQRATMGFIFSLVAGALIFINGLLLTSYQADLSQLFPWLTNFETTFLMFLGVACGICVLLGAVIIYLPTFEVIGAILVLIFSLIAILVGGGFIVGVASGVVGGALAILKK